MTWFGHPQFTLFLGCPENRINFNYLSSAFVRDTEIPKLFEQHLAEGMTVYPLLVRDCAWQEIPWLARLQLRPPEARPLATQPRNADSILATVAREIADIVRAPPPDNTATSGRPAVPPSQARANSRHDSHEWVKESVEHFDERMARTFPGLRDTRVYDSPPEIVRRLVRFFDASAVPSETRDNIWWFRGSGCSHIEDVRQLADDKLLIEGMEISPATLWVHRDVSTRYQIMYLAVKAEPSMQRAGTRYRDKGIIREEYAVLGDRAFSLSEYEDGTAEIDGQFVSTSGAERRVRFLTPGNLLIAPKGSPVNNVREDVAIESWMDRLLGEPEAIEAFWRYFRGLRRIH